MIRLGLLAILAGLSAAPASAGALPACLPPVEVAQAHVVRVEKNGVLVLTDGRAIKPEGLLLPGNDMNPAAGSFHDAAMAALGDLTINETAILHAQKPKEDRYGRLRAQIETTDRDEPWLQVSMLRRGLARVSVAPDRPECANELYAAEAEARGAHRGIWSSRAYAVRAPESLRASDLGTFQIVEGQVMNASVRGGRGYLNFGRDWRNDFTVTIAPEDLKAFRAANIDPASYAGKHVRVRGWIERMNGFEIEAAMPEAIEILPEQPRLRSQAAE